MMSKASFPVWLIRAQAGKEGFDKKQRRGVRYQDQSQGYRATFVRVWEIEAVEYGVRGRVGEEGTPAQNVWGGRGWGGRPCQAAAQGTRVCAVRRAAWRGRPDSVIYNQSSHSAVCDSLRHHGLQYTRLPCPSPTPGACPNSCPSSWWCHQTISSSIVPFSSCLQSFPASGSFPMSQLFTSGGQSIGASASASASVLPLNIQDWFPLWLTGVISLQSKGLTRVFPSTTVQKHQFFSAQLSLCSNFHIHTWLLEKP